MKTNLLTFILSLFGMVLFAQTDQLNNNNNNNSNRNNDAQSTHRKELTVATRTQFDIPSAPTFDVLGINAEQIAQPTVLRNFKVDWTANYTSKSPNISIQAQPIWELLYRSDLNRYQNATPWMRMLSTLDISAGTVKMTDTERKFATIAKINLYAQRDPLTQPGLFDQAEKNYRNDKKERKNLIREATKHYVRSQGQDDKNFYGKLLDSLEKVQVEAEKEHGDEIERIALKYVQKYWNSAHLDLAYGKIYTYKMTGWDSLDFQKAVHSVWLNGSVGIGRHLLATSLVRYTLDSVGKHPLHSFAGGVGVRYGSAKFNFFTEWVYRVENAMPTVSDANTQPIWQVKNTLAYGGNWRIHHRVALGFGVRAECNKSLKLVQLIPMANLKCVMF
jgi:hypothetical protein